MEEPNHWATIIDEIATCRMEICKQPDVNVRLRGLKKLRDLSAKLVTGSNQFMGVALVLESAIVPCLCKILLSDDATCSRQHNLEAQTQTVEIEAKIAFEMKLQVVWIFINLSMSNHK